MFLFVNKVTAEQLKQRCKFGAQTHLGGSHVLRVLLLARRWVEDDVVYRLDELELHDAFDQQACKQLLI